MSHIVIQVRGTDGSLSEPEILYVDTIEEISDAEEALADAGLDMASVYVGEPYCGDDVKTHRVIFAQG